MRFCLCRPLPGIESVRGVVEGCCEQLRRSGSGLRVAGRGGADTCPRPGMTQPNMTRNIWWKHVFVYVIDLQAGQSGGLKGVTARMMRCRGWGLTRCRCAGCRRERTRVLIRRRGRWTTSTRCCVRRAGTPCGYWWKSRRSSLGGCLHGEGSGEPRVWRLPGWLRRATVARTTQLRNVRRRAMWGLA